MDSKPGRTVSRDRETKFLHSTSSFTWNAPIITEQLFDPTRSDGVGLRSFGAKENSLYRAASGSHAPTSHSPLLHMAT